DAMSIQVRNVLDADGLIGSVINDLTLLNVKASAEVALQTLVQSGTIRNYRELKVRQLVETPDVIEIRFEWLAGVPLNYIIVRYSVSITSGDVEVLST